VPRSLGEPAPSWRPGWRGERTAGDCLVHQKDVLARLEAHGAALVGEVVQYEEATLLCYVRGPEGTIIGLAEQLS
jgi:hypothetical protein